MAEPRDRSHLLLPLERVRCHACALHPCPDGHNASLTVSGQPLCSCVRARSDETEPPSALVDECCFHSAQVSHSHKAGPTTLSKAAMKEQSRQYASARVASPSHLAWRASPTAAAHVAPGLGTRPFRLSDAWAGLCQRSAAEGERSEPSCPLAGRRRFGKVHPQKRRTALLVWAGHYSRKRRRSSLDRLLVPPCE